MVENKYNEVLRHSNISQFAIEINEKGSDLSINTTVNEEELSCETLIEQIQYPFISSVNVKPFSTNQEECEQILHDFQVLAKKNFSIVNAEKIKNGVYAGSKGRYLYCLNNDIVDELKYFLRANSSCLIGAHYSEIVSCLNGPVFYSEHKRGKTFLASIKLCYPNKSEGILALELTLDPLDDTVKEISFRDLTSTER